MKHTARQFVPAALGLGLVALATLIGAESASASEAGRALGRAAVGLGRAGRA